MGWKEAIVPEYSALEIKAMRLRDRAVRFHKKNPHVYEYLVIESRNLKALGHKRIGVCMLWEVLRWSGMKTKTSESFKLADAFKPWYAREITQREEDLSDIFQKKQSILDYLPEE